MNPDYDTRKLAGATTKGWYDTSENGYTDCDIKLYKRMGSAGVVVDINWSVSGSPASDEIHLPHLLAHELGHCLGLNDTTISGSMMEGTIAHGEIRNTLDADDEAALLHIYGP